VLQGSDDGSPRQLDLECVVTEALCAPDNRFRNSFEVILRRLDAVQHRFGIRIAPWLVGDAAERETCFPDRVAIHFKRRGHRHQRERIRRSVADLQIRVVVGKPLCRQINRRDDLVLCEVGVDLRCVTGQTVELGKGDRAIAIFAGDMNHGLERGQGHTHV